MVHRIRVCTLITFQQWPINDLIGSSTPNFRDDRDRLWPRTSNCVTHTSPECLSDSGRSTDDNVSKCITIAPPPSKRELDVAPPPGENFINDCGVFIVSVCHAFPLATRKINICGDIHYKPVSTVYKSQKQACNDIPLSVCTHTRVSSSPDPSTQMTPKMQCQ